MDWQIVIAIGVGITAFAGLGGMYYAHLNQQNSTIYNLPVLHSEVSRPEDGMRWVTFSLEILPGRPDWNVVGARINRNWRRRRLLAEGVYTPSLGADPYGIAVDFQCQPDGPWQRRLVHDRPVKKGVLLVHSGSHNLRISLKVALSSHPSRSRWILVNNRAIE